jgi:hypothetical protein
MERRIASRRAIGVIRARVSRARRSRYIDGQALYESEAEPMNRADLVVDNDDLVHPRIVSRRA